LADNIKKNYGTLYETLYNNPVSWLFNSTPQDSNTHNVIRDVLLRISDKHAVILALF
jgi:hypothetical protein